MLLMENFSDADFRATMLRAIRLLGIFAAIAAVIVGFKFGWQTAALLLIGAAISATGLWEWLRLMSAVMSRMDVGAVGKPIAMVLVGFFLRLGLSVVVLYVSLKTLHGSVSALALGLGLGVFALFVEALRLVKAWTV